MGQTRYYQCIFTPVGEYFFGGERNFPFGSQSLAEKKDYYIGSEDFPSQATVFGALRYMLLEKEGLLNNNLSSGNTRDPLFNERQAALIGSEGFSMSLKDTMNTYGILKKISPLFLYDKKDKTRLIPAPLNHRVHIDNGKHDCSQLSDETCPGKVPHSSPCEIYTPLKMKHLKNVYTDLGTESLLPEDYDGKAGLTDKFLMLDAKKTLINREDVIGSLTQTRIARQLEEGGLFKMEYKYLKEAYAFSVMVELDLPESFTDTATSKKPFADNGLVFLGMDKSVFHYETKQIDIDTFRSLESDISKIQMTDHGDLTVYYAASDCYEITENKKPASLFWILQKKNLRTLEKQAGRNYQSSLKKSRLYHMIKAGSVFYVKKESEAEKIFQDQFDYPGLTQIGFNHIVKTGE